MPAPSLKPAPLEEPLHHRHRHDDAYDLGAEVDEKRPHRRVRADDERQPQDEQGYEKEGGCDEGPQHVMASGSGGRLRD